MSHHQAANPRIRRLDSNAVEKICEQEVDANGYLSLPCLGFRLHKVASFNKGSFLAACDVSSCRSQHRSATNDLFCKSENRLQKLTF
jgi:hypothetical protein